MAGIIRLSNTGTGNGQSTITTAASGDVTYTLPSGGGTFVTTASTQALTVPFASGTVSAPSVTFLGDSNTGIYSPAADTIAFTEGGVESLRIDSSGRVGIGNSSPSYTLDVTGTHRNSGIYFNQNDTPQGTAGTITRHSVVGLTTRGITGSVFDWSVYSAGGTALITNGTGTNNIAFPGGNVAFTGGSVGIGTTSPLAKLHLYENAATFIGTRSENSVAAWINGVETGGNYTIYSNYSANILFSNGGSERARIDSSGRLLVGLSSDITGGTIQAAGAVGVASAGDAFDGRRFTASANGPFVFLRKSRSNTIGSQGLVLNGDSLGGILWFGSDGSNWIPGARIEAEVDGTPGTNDMPGRLVFSTTADGASSAAERMRIQSGGQVLIGRTSVVSGFNSTLSLDYTTGSQYGFALRNTAASTFGAVVFINSSNSLVGEISCTTTSTSYNTSSDYRLKENVTAVSDGIARLQQLKPSRFNFIADPAKTVDGFIAHEVQDVVPEAITGEKDAVNDDGNPVYQGIDQSKLVPLLTAALQEAIAKIESLEARLTAAGI